MKPRFSRWGVLCAGGLLLLAIPTPHLNAQQRADRSAEISARVVERGAHHARWETLTDVIDPVSGETNRVAGSFVQLEAGLNRRDRDGNWIESEARVEVVNGQAVAARAGHQAVWKANLNQQKLFEFVGADGEYLSGSVVAIAYHDRASGESVILGTVQDADGAVVGGEEIIYGNAFDGLLADVRYRNFRAGMEQDIVLRESPAEPEAYGLSAATTELEIWTEFFDTDDPEAQPMIVRGEPDAGLRTLMAEPDLVDELLSFGGYQMVMGRAFYEGTTTVEGESTIMIPIAKRWLTGDGRKFLIEAAAYSDIREELGRLPRRLAAEGQQDEGRRIVGRGQVPRLARTSQQAGAMIARLDRPDNPPGFVMDFLTVQSQANMTFLSGTTYLVSGGAYLTGTTTFQAGTTIKFTKTNYAKITMSEGSVVNTGTGAVVLTAEDDDTVGESIDPPNTQSGRYGSAYLNFYNLSSGSTLNNFKFRFATKAIESYTSWTHRLNYPQFSGCDTGIYAYNTTWEIAYGGYCTVPTPTYDYGGSTFTVIGYFSDNCSTVDSDGDGLSDGFELANFDHFNFTGNDDPDNDGLANSADPAPATANGPATFQGKTLEKCPQ